ncbi:MAG: tetratricopeptide repeat protein, partial [Trebonia sp.]
MSSAHVPPRASGDREHDLARALGMQGSATAALASGDLAGAEAAIAAAADIFAAVANWRRFADAQALRGEIARASGDTAAAERSLRAALSVYFAIEDRYLAVRMLSAIAELRLSVGAYDEAEELSRQAVERMPGDVAALAGLAYAQWQGGSPADAEATFGHALRWDAAAAMALAGRGQVRADLGRYEGALHDLSLALLEELAPEAEADTRSARALALAGLGRAAEAEAEL